MKSEQDISVKWCTDPIKWRALHGNIRLLVKASLTEQGQFVLQWPLDLYRSILVIAYKLTPGKYTTGVCVMQPAISGTSGIASSLGTKLEKFELADSIRLLTPLQILQCLLRTFIKHPRENDSAQIPENKNSSELIYCGHIPWGI